jgi:hypothetical protein
MAGITNVPAPIGPGPAVGGQLFASGASTLPKPSRFISITAPGATGLGVVMNDGSTFTLTVTAGQWLEISVLSFTAGNTANGVALW